MPFFRKYNTLLVTGTTAIRIPIVKRGVVDFAVGADWTPAAGDVKVFVDAAGVANITNLPTAIASGNTAQWEFILTAAELSCKQILVMVSDSATKAVEDQCFIVETYGNASAMYVADLSLANLPANVTQLLGTAWLTPAVAGTPDVNSKQLGGTAQTGRDVGASVLLSTGTGTGQLDFTSGVVKSNIVQILGTAITETAGQIAAAFKQFFDVASPTGTMKAITNVVTTTNLTTNNDKTGYALTQAFPTNFSSLSITAGGLVDITQTAADKAWSTTTRLLTAGTNIVLAKGVGVTGFNDILATDVWSAVTRTITGNGDKTGYSLSQAFPTNFADLAITVTTGKVTVGTNSDKTGYTVSTVSDKTGYSLASPQAFDLTGNITGNVSGSVGSVTGLTAANLDATISSRSTYAGGAVASVTAGVTVTTNNDKTGYTLTQAFPANFSSLSITAGGLVDIVQGAADKVWLSVSRVLTAGTNIVLAKGVGLTGLNDITAADVWAVGVRTLTSFGTLIADIWSSATVGMVTVGSIGKKLADWVLGTDSKVLLSTDAQAGVTIPTVTALTNNVTVGAFASTLSSPGVKKNTILNNFEFYMIDSADHVSGKVGLAVTATRSIDGAAFGACANAATEVANGIYKISLAAADVNGDVITLKFTAVGADATLITILTKA